MKAMALGVQTPRQLRKKRNGSPTDTLQTPDSVEMPVAAQPGSRSFSGELDG
jgi:hypothetical protein